MSKSQTQNQVDRIGQRVVYYYVEKDESPHLDAALWERNQAGLRQRTDRRLKEGYMMPGYLIKDTTVEERRKIVEESLGNIEATCDGCSQRVVDMYDAYIRGEKELREITMEFNARYVRGDMEQEERRRCPM